VTLQPLAQVPPQPARLLGPPPPEQQQRPAMAQPPAPEQQQQQVPAQPPAPEQQQQRAPAQPPAPEQQQQRAPAQPPAPEQQPQRAPVQVPPPEQRKRRAPVQPPPPAPAQEAMAAERCRSRAWCPPASLLRTPAQARRQSASGPLEPMSSQTSVARMGEHSVNLYEQPPVNQHAAAYRPAVADQWSRE
jgi:fused signal recognition particle receptor